MMETRNLNLRTMKSVYAYYSTSADEMREIWHVFRMMHILGFIRETTWDRFFNECKSWRFDPEKNAVLDEEDRIIYQN